MTSDELGRAEAEVTAVFARYEAALVGNDVDTLDELFWVSGRTVRFGLADEQYGFDEVSAFRRSLPRQTPPRQLRRTEVVALTSEVVVVTTEFVPEGGEALGRQSQVWLHQPEGWRVASAHVSWR